MNKIFFFLLSINILFLNSCQHERMQMKKIGAIEEKYNSNSYEAGLAYMAYLMNQPNDLDYAIGLVNKLMDGQRYLEAVYALSELGKKFEDSRIHYLLSLSYRHKHWYKEAMESIQKAISMKDDETYFNELSTIESFMQIWNEISQVNSQIKIQGLTPALLFSRAELLIMLGNFEAAQLDIDSVINIPEWRDEAYNLMANKLLYINEYARLDSLVNTWEQLAEGEWQQTVRTMKESITGIVKYKPLVDSGKADATDIINYARYLATAGEFKEAENTLQEGQIRYPSNMNLKYAKLLVYIESNQKDKAIRTASELENAGIALDPGIKNYLSGKN